MSVNGILDESPLIEEPRQYIDEDGMLEEKSMAKFAKTKEFKRLKDHLESRIEFYKQYLPDGRALTDVSKEERQDMWVVANTIIAEIQLILSTYDNAVEAVQDAQRQG